MDLNTIIKRRKSPEAFLDDDVSSETIKEIVEVGNYSPIFGNIHFTVISDKDLLNKINETALEFMKNSGLDFAVKLANTPGYSAVRNANTIVVISGEGGNDENGFNMANVSLAAENIILKATEMGIGSRFMMGAIEAIKSDIIQSEINLPENYVPLIIVALGNVEKEFLEEERNKNLDNIDYIN